MQKQLTIDNAQLTTYLDVKNKIMCLFHKVEKIKNTIKNIFNFQLSIYIRFSIK